MGILVKKKEELKKSRHYNAIRKSGLYVNVPIDWCVRFDLTLLDVYLFQIIYFYTYKAKKSNPKSDDKFYKSVDWLCVCSNTTKPTVRRSLEKLNERGFISKKIELIREKHWVCYEASIDPENANRGAVEEQLEIELSIHPRKK